MRREICAQEPAAMSTTGRKFAQRTHDRTLNKVLDARTKAVLATVITEPRGRTLDAYLLAGSMTTKPKR